MEHKRIKEKEKWERTQTRPDMLHWLGIDGALNITDSVPFQIVSIMQMPVPHGRKSARLLTGMCNQR